MLDKLNFIRNWNFFKTTCSTSPVGSVTIKSFLWFRATSIPVVGLGLLYPALAGLAMAASSVSVVSRSLLLKRWKPQSWDMFDTFYLCDSIL